MKSHNDVSCGVLLTELGYSSWDYWVYTGGSGVLYPQHANNSVLSVATFVVRPKSNVLRQPKLQAASSAARLRVVQATDARTTEAASRIDTPPAAAPSLSARRTGRGDTRV